MKHRGGVISRGLALAVLVPFLSTSCSGKASKPAGTGSGSGSASTAYVAPTDPPRGLDLRLSDGTQGASPVDRATLAAAKKLAIGETNALLARAKPITAEATDQASFAFRGRSTPPPRAGQTITAAFPPPPSSLLPPTATDAAAALTVVRWMPEGKVPLAPELSVTFSQPMVAVTSQDDAAKVTPVQLSPQPAGRWRWIGTRTIVFDPEVRFPQATTYQVTIPAGTKGTIGAALAKPATFSFETPPPSVIASFPSDHEPQRLDVPMFVLFDQKIDPKAVLAQLHVTADSAPQQVQLLDAAEIAKHAQLERLVAAATKNEQVGRWLAFRTARPLPADATVIVSLRAGMPSAEGPNRTQAPQSFGFKTYPPLKLVRAECGWGDRCRPGMPLQFEFNNPLDVDKFDPAIATVGPDLPGVKVEHQGNYVVVHGHTRARTSYKVTIGRGLVDAFGQTLGTDETKAFAVGDAEPTFYGPTGMVVLDPAAAKPTLDFFSANYPQLKVKLYKVTPDDQDAFGRYQREQWNKDKPPRAPGTLVFDQLVKTALDPNQLVETSIDLSRALDKDGHGHVVAIVEPHPWKEKWDPPRMISWVQATDLAVDAHVDGTDLVAFATELATGKPAAGVTVELRPFKITGTTDATGLATLPLSRTAPSGGHHVVARRGDDTVILTEQGGWWNESGSWIQQTPGVSLAWYVFDDRKLYKPGEQVTLKGWLRAIDHGKGGDVAALAGAVSRVTYRVIDSAGNQIGTGAADVNVAGGFDTSFTLPKTPSLGYAQVELTSVGRMGGSYTHGIQVEEFRRPEFEVSAQASQGPFLVGSGGDVTVQASYFAGGPLPGAQTSWYVTASQTSFTPPNRDDYVFGAWQPWWGRHGGDDEDDAGGGQRSWSHEGKTDATGAHTLHLDFLSANPTVPMSVITNASVTDVNRQTWTASTALIVHPSTAYVGLKARRPFVDQGTPFDLDVVGVDLDGKALAGAKIEVRAARLDWRYERGRYQTQEVDPQTCAVVAAATPSPCQFTTKTGGTYQVTATIVDASGRPNRTTMTFWVSGGDRPPAREVSQEVVQLIPDKREYAAGNTAELLVQAPFYPAEGLVTWRRSGIVKMERITMAGPTTVITVPITDAMVPNLHVQVDLVGSAARTDDRGTPDPKLPKRPAYAVGTINLPVPPRQRTLAVTIAPSAAKLAPGETTTLALEVKDATGQPVADAEAAVVVVDEAVLALTGYQFPDPIGAFYAQRDAGVRDHYVRAYVALASPDVAFGFGKAGYGPGGGGSGWSDEQRALPSATAPMMEPSEDESPDLRKRDSNKDLKQAETKSGKKNGADAGSTAIVVRSNFNPLAAFSPTVKTDAAGRATVSVKLPDNLTRYRIVAIASAGERQFGKGESAVTARLPLMVRPSPPRFLNFGDTFELPVVLQNQTDAAMTVRVAVRATNAAITDGGGREVVVPPNDRLEVRFPAAAELAGTARFQIVGSIVGGTWSDAAEVALPVWTPATTEGFATYGVIDDGAIAQPVALPGKVVTQFGGLEVTTASTNLQALTDAFIYLVRYPYECAEQRASRILAIAALRDVLAAFKSKDLPSPKALEVSIASDVERLSQLQNHDGGFAYWERGRPSEPYVSVYVTNALARAKAKGYAVPTNILDQAKQYLREIEQHIPSHYGVDIRRAIASYALYTRKQLGDLDVAKAQKLLRDAGGVDKLTMEANGWLLGTLAGNAGAATERAAIVRHVLNKVSETAGAANFTTSYGDGAHLLLASDRRVDAVMLESLIQEQPSLDLIPKVVTGLLGHRKAGRWLNTQENTFALLALDRYFQTYEKVTPNFVARVWLGADYAGELAFRGRSTQQLQLDIPMKDVAAHDNQALTIQKDGVGRLYYRIGMTYAPESLKLEPADYGFVVTRVYEGVDDPKDVTRDAQGVWRIKAGARVRVKLTMVNENRRYHVALVDPLPAGLEPMNPALAVTGPVPTDPAEQASRGAYWWWYGPWYEHQNLRDERVEAFAALLWEGVHTYNYVARATTPGNFVVPPPKAEEMYMPETFGRGGSDRVVVE